VNEAFARKFNIGPNPVGKRMGLGRADGPLDVEIVGLVKDAKYDEVKGAMPPVFFVPYPQTDKLGGIIFYVRGSSRTILKAVPEVMAKLDPNMPVISLTEMPRQIEANTYMDRMVGTLSAAFALVATLLTAVGLYGVLAFTVAQRTREIGLRMALGADSARVRRMVMGQVGRMTIVGAVIGIAAALAIGRYAQALLFELEGHDPVTVVVAVVLLSLVAGAAGFIPAWRASRVEPMRALRSE
jgi:ABC-type antimicrobial peptide transport system permease subunit